MGNSFDSYISLSYLDPDLVLHPFDEERDQPTDAAQLHEEARNEEESRNGIDEEKVRANLQTKIRELEEADRKKEDEIMKLKEEIRRLKQVETEKAFCQIMQVTLQKMLLELKKNEKKDEKEDEKKNEMGYEFPNDKFYRVMYVLTQNHNSVWELVMNLLLCFVTVNRGTEYKERSSEGGRSEEGEEEASKKRKRRR